MQEEFRNIPGFEGIYQVSNYGRVKSLYRIIEYSDGRKQPVRERILIPINNGGYYAHTLRNITKHCVIRLHRLVAMAFIENPHNFNEINHKDANKLNNNVDNLEWCTHQYNMEHMFRLGLRSRKKICI